MLTTQNGNPMTAFNYDYWVQLMKINQGQAEEYRLKVTAPKPGAINTHDLRMAKNAEAVETEVAPVEEVKVPEEITPIVDEDNILLKEENTVETIKENVIEEVIKPKRVIKRRKRSFTKK